MTIRTWLVLGAAAGLLACGSPTDVAAPPPPAEPVVSAAEPSISGLYSIEGVTIETASGQSRDISGKIVLAQTGGRYTSTFNLVTEYPTPDGPIRADVIGQGEGSIDGQTLRGKAETQLVIAGVPGLDTQFAFVPRRVGPRIVSNTVGRIMEDGTIVIEIDSEGAPGEEYAGTHTTIRGTLISRDPTDVR